MTEPTFLKEKAQEEIKNEKTTSFKEKLEKLGHAIMGKEIKWNFTKFLVDKNGNIVKRYSPTVTPEEIAPKIEELLAEK